MNINSYKLDKIINFINEYAAVNSVNIDSSSVIIAPPVNGKVIEVDLNRAMKYTIEFTLGNKKENMYG